MSETETNIINELKQMNAELKQKIEERNKLAETLIKEKEALRQELAKMQTEEKLIPPFDVDMLEVDQSD